MIGTRTESEHVLRAAGPTGGRPPAGGLGFDWLMSLLSGIFLGGLFLDGWAHTHGRVDDTFFTPWHGVLYSGYLANAVCLVLTAVRNRVRGHRWSWALPAGYELSLVGALLWIPAGIADLIWHEVFGFEASVEALYSPPHLLLALGAGLIFAGPLRAAWRRPGPDARAWRGSLPMLLSVAFILSTFTFFIQIAHPVANLWGRGQAPLSRAIAGQAEELGVVSIFLSSAVLMGVILPLVARWRLPKGSLTLVFALNAGAMGVLWDQGGYPVLPVAAQAGAGVAADLLLALLGPSARRAVRLRLFASATPALACLLFFASLWLTEGLWWPIHLWAGAAVVSGMIGWLLSYLVVPPEA